MANYLTFQPNSKRCFLKSIIMFNHWSRKKLGASK